MSAQDFSLLLAPALLQARLPVESAAHGQWLTGFAASRYEAVDAVPIRALSGDWHDYAPRSGRNAGLQVAHAEATAVAPGGWEFSLGARSVAVIDGSRGAFDAVHNYKQKQIPASGAHFDIDATEFAVVMAGIGTAHSWRVTLPGLGTLWLTPGLALGSVRRLRNVAYDGQIDYNAASGYSFNLSGSDSNSRKSTGGFGQPGALGWGGSVDLGLMWQPVPQAFVNLSVVNLWSRVQVKDVANTSETLSSSTRSFDSQGYVNYTPLINGRYTATRLALRMPRQVSLNVGYRINSDQTNDGMQIGARMEHIGNLNLPGLWASVPVTNSLQLQLDADLRFHSFGIGVTHPYAKLMLRTRSLPVGTSRTLGWSLAMQVPF